jgi:hypothetical protein
MWLPKDERETLVFYYQKRVAGSSSFPCKEPMDESIDRYLRERGLIETDVLAGKKLVSLTSKGLTLGQKYNSKIGTISVWCVEYMWFFVVLGAIIGAVTLAVTIFKK